MDEKPQIPPVEEEKEALLQRFLGDIEEQQRAGQQMGAQHKSLSGGTPARKMTTWRKKKSLDGMSTDIDVSHKPERVIMDLGQGLSYQMPPQQARRLANALRRHAAQAEANQPFKKRVRTRQKGGKRRDR